MNAVISEKSEELPQSLSAESLAKIDKWVAKFPAEQKQSAVLQALRIAQDEHGWLSEPLMDVVADYLDMPKINVYGVATFYGMYHLKPVGKHCINVCTNLSCMLTGSEEIVDHLEDRLGIKMGETTADGKFTLKEVECLGACVSAPLCEVATKNYETLTPEKIDALLEELGNKDG